MALAGAVFPDLPSNIQLIPVNFLTNLSGSTLIIRTNKEFLMLNRFALVLHWFFFLIGLWASVAALIGIDDGFGLRVFGALFFLFCSTATGWTIRFILTGSKALFPWSKPKESNH